MIPLPPDLPQDLAVTTPTPVRQNDIAHLNKNNIWSDTFCKAQIASGTIIPAFDPREPAWEKSLRRSALVTLLVLMVVIPFTFVAAMVFGR